MNNNGAEDSSDPQSVNSAGEQPEIRLDAPDQRIGATAQPQVILDRESRKTRGQRQWDGLADLVIRGSKELEYQHPYVVLGGAGTGKTSALIDAVVEYLVSGGSAEEVLFVTPSKESATRIKNEIFERVSDIDAYVATGTPVRSVHSWAFAVYRSIRQEEGENPPRLITGAEHDAQLRILLKGEVEDGASGWPADMVPALTFVGFARQLRDLILRATERGVGADRLAELGAQFSRPMWVAAGEFLRRYEQLQRLSESDNLNASELVHTVVHAMDASSAGQRVVNELREKLQLVLVDDAHNLDPAAAQFIERLIAPGTRALIAGDPDQCVFHFRGADEAFLNRHAQREDYRIVLSASRRLAEGQARAIRRLSSHLPHHASRIPVRAFADSGASTTNTAVSTPARASISATAAANSSTVRNGLRVIKAGSATAEKLHVADAVRRAHLEEGVAWEDIAVIVRGVGQISGMRRVLLSHGVPVMVDPTSVVLAEQSLVSMLLLAVEAAYRELTPAETTWLLESAVGGADPVTLRKVHRALSRAIAHLRVNGESLPVRNDGLPFQTADCVTALVSDTATAQQREDWTRFMGPIEHRVLDGVQSVIDAGKQAFAENPHAVETVLWRVWQATGLSTRLQTHALRGGTVGSQADQNLDAVMSLFDLAGDFAERNPQASLRTFVDEVRAQELPTGTRDRRGGEAEAVEILPAHAAAGRQWKVVVVAGVQEDLWPAGPTVGGLFGQLELVDYLDRGITPDTIVSRISPAVQEERRLFLVALSRASEYCLITAVDSTGEEGTTPSRFLEEIAVPGEEEEISTPQEPNLELDLGLDLGQGVGREAEAAKTSEDGQAAEDEIPAIPRVMAIEPLIAELRDALGDPRRPHQERQAAARNLAKLAKAQVFGADPSQWWGMRAPSTTERLLDREGHVRLSPSRLVALENCSLNAFLDRHRGVETDTESQRVGNAIHAIAEAIVGGLSEEDALLAGESILPLIADGPEFHRNNTIQRWREGISKLHGFITERLPGASGAGVASEKMLEIPLGELSDGTEVVLNGRIDLMITDPDGTTVVYDFKTAKSPLSAKDANDSPQLSAYQFMVMRTEGLRNNGAALVFPGTKKDVAETRQQDPLSEEEMAGYSQHLLELAEVAAGPSFLATPGKHCEFCDFAASCPAQPNGRMLVS